MAVQLAGTVELGDVTEGLAALGRAITARKQAAFAEIKPLAKRDLRARGKDRRGPDGQAWAPADPESRRKARRNRRRNRRPGDLGKLVSAWRSKQEPEQLRFWNALEYAGVHDQGGTAAHGARMPARPFGYFSEDLADEAVKIWADTVLKEW